MSLDDLVNVTITAQTTVPSRTGFGIPMVLAQHTHWTERARIYTSLAGMVSDGFTTTEPAYKAVQAIFSQNPKPTSVIIGRAINESPKKVNYIPIMPTVPAVTTYTIYINGVAGTFASDASPTVSEVCAGLKIAIDALGAGVTVTDNHTSIDVEATTVANVFTDYVNDRTLFTRAETTPNSVGTGVAGDIAAVSAVNDDWYALVLCNLGKDVISAAAAYIETVTKILAVASADDAIYSSGSTTDIAYVLKSADYARTFIMYHPKAAYEFPHAAWVGKCLPKDPGSITWMFKTLAGVTVTGLTPTEVIVLQGVDGISGKHCNSYVSTASVSMTQSGVSTAGEFIDITNGVDFIHARMQESIFTEMVNADKIPYTDPGGAIIESKIRAVLTLSVNQEILAASPAPTVTIPKVADIAVADRARRAFTGILFDGTLAGAVHSLVINGTVSV